MSPLTLFCKSTIECVRRSIESYNIRTILFYATTGGDARMRGMKTRTKNARNENRAAALDGIEVKVHAYPKLSIQQIYLLRVYIELTGFGCELYPDKPLWVQCIPSDRSERDCYALDSSSSDNASRLVIRIRGITDQGKAFDGVARAGGEKAVEKLNAIYDILVGKSV